MIPPKLLTVPEVAAMLRCGRSKVFELLQDGTLQRGPCFGRKTVILQESVFNVMESAYDPPPPPKKRIRNKQAHEDAIDAWMKDARRKK